MTKINKIVFIKNFLLKFSHSFKLINDSNQESKENSKKIPKKKIRENLPF
jgi:hypothetical protein